MAKNKVRLRRSTGQYVAWFLRLFVGLRIIDRRLEIVCIENGKNRTSKVTGKKGHKFVTHKKFYYFWVLVLYLIKRGDTDTATFLAFSSATPWFSLQYLLEPHEHNINNTSSKIRLSISAFRSLYIIAILCLICATPKYDALFHKRLSLYLYNVVFTSI